MCNVKLVIDYPSLNIRATDMQSASVVALVADRDPLIAVMADLRRLN